MQTATKRLRYILAQYRQAVCFAVATQYANIISYPNNMFIVAHRQKMWVAVMPQPYQQTCSVKAVSPVAR